MRAGLAQPSEQTARADAEGFIHELRRALVLRLQGRSLRMGETGRPVQLRRQAPGIMGGGRPWPGSKASNT
jgi:hypothetical protein